MTEDRWRPLTAFALVSLLCALILALNIGGSGAGGVVTARQAGETVSTSRVVFGDVLSTRSTQADSTLGAKLSGVGPLSRAVAKTTKNAHHAHHKAAHHKAAHHKAAHHPTKHKAHKGKKHAHKKKHGHKHHGHKKKHGHKKHHGHKHHGHKHHGHKKHGHQSHHKTRHHGWPHGVIKDLHHDAPTHHSWPHSNHWPGNHWPGNHGHHHW